MTAAKSIEAVWAAIPTTFGVAEPKTREEREPCPNCLDTGLACDAHPYQPTRRAHPEGCECGALAMPCPTCELGLALPVAA